MKVAIIGAGPAGLAASIISSQKNETVVFEKNTDAGKKLLLTGSGRCNIKNACNDLSKYHSNNNELIKDIINETNLHLLDNFFQNIGLVLKNENGYYYPYSEKSSSVLSCLKSSSKANFRFNTPVNSIKKIDNKFIINNEAFDKVIITTGGLSYPKTGSDGAGYNIAKSFNHHINKLNPSLMGLITYEGFEKKWTGIRCEADVTSYINGKYIKKEHGKLQLTSYGLSGICIFNLSKSIRKGLDEEKLCEVSINFSAFDKESLIKHLLNSKSISSILDGFLDYKLTNIILNILNIPTYKRYSELSSDMQDKLILLITNFKVKITDTKSFLDAQVTTGGIPLDEINLNSMESKLVDGLFFAGEVIDLDGDCGGYNLTLSFITGLLAGEGYD